MPIRKAFLMSVNAGLEAEYKRRHNPIWKELEQTLKDYGVSNYSIFLRQETCELFAYLEIESEERWRMIANTEICRQWWKHMSDIMPSSSDVGPQTSSLAEVFHLD